MQTHAYMQQNSVHPLTLSKILMQIRKVEVNYFEHSYGNGFLNCKLDYWSFGVTFAFPATIQHPSCLHALGWSQQEWNCSICTGIQKSRKRDDIWGERVIIEWIDLTIQICNLETIYLDGSSPIARCIFEAASAGHHGDSGDCGDSQGCRIRA